MPNPLKFKQVRVPSSYKCTCTMYMYVWDKCCFHIQIQLSPVYSTSISSPIPTCTCTCMNVNKVVLSMVLWNYTCTCTVYMQYTCTHNPVRLWYTYTYISGSLLVPFSRFPLGVCSCLAIHCGTKKNKMASTPTCRCPALRTGTDLLYMVNQLSPQSCRTYTYTCIYTCVHYLWSLSVSCIGFVGLLEG